MFSVTSSLIGAILVASTALNAAPAALQISLKDWAPVVGDRFVVDTLSNEGYLIHTDGRYVRFPVITGQRRGVYYIGRSYNATTPKWDWEVKSREIKGDRVTFGPTGRFLRMYKDDERTAYGIHEHKSEIEMFARDTRFQSMGCVIVTSAMLDVIEDTYNLNGGSLIVKTRYGVEDAVGLAFPREEIAQAY